MTKPAAPPRQKTMFASGFRDGAPFIIVIIPFSMLFGVLATEAGLSVFETLSFSVVVIAGAAQFTALQLMAENAPTVVVIASALAVNLRMAMYSAALTPHIGGATVWQRALAAYCIVDQSYAVALLKYEQSPEMTPPQKLAYFFGAIAPVIPVWWLFTVVGAMVGEALPHDFAVPITFLAIIAPALRTRAHVAAAATAAILSLLLDTVPYNLGVLLAGIGGMMVGARIEASASKGAQT
jgi:predicted branched-subunit amino acid permease